MLLRKTGRCLTMGRYVLKRFVYMALTLF
ncbi:Oligopeptide transport system permease protein oppB [Bacillus thuringiensis serovar israelensis ATCC 35646]|nr:Oligopeptide transport system permease protein oppB [Bacillus thuringiensis serovar israelensis ATCC 35646]